MSVRTATSSSARDSGNRIPHKPVSALLYLYRDRAETTRVYEQLYIFEGYIVIPSIIRLAFIGVMDERKLEYLTQEQVNQVISFPSYVHAQSTYFFGRVKFRRDGYDC